MISVQLAEVSPCSPTKEEIWKFFSNDIVQAVGRWQMEKKDTPTLTSTTLSCDGRQYVNNLLQEVASSVEKMLSECNSQDEKSITLAKVVVL